MARRSDSNRCGQGLLLLVEILLIVHHSGAPGTSQLDLNPVIGGNMGAEVYPHSTAITSLSLRCRRPLTRAGQGATAVDGVSGAGNPGSAFRGEKENQFCNLCHIADPPQRMGCL